MKKYIDQYGFEWDCKLVVHDGANWDICEVNGGWFMAIPTEFGVASGCKSSSFGDIKHVKGLIYNYAAFRPEDFTAYGLRLLHHELRRCGYTLKQLFTSGGYIASGTHR
jgi:hypothetical protein